jgi:hypothetical protein
MPVKTGVSEAIIFPGEIAWLLSGGKLRPMYHRVRTHQDIQERMSLLFFADLEPESCQPWISNGTNDTVDIGAHVRQNVIKFGLKGFKALRTNRIGVKPFATFSSSQQVSVGGGLDQ